MTIEEIKKKIAESRTAIDKLHVDDKNGRAALTREVDALEKQLAIVESGSPTPPAAGGTFKYKVTGNALRRGGITYAEGAVINLTPAEAKAIGATVVKVQ